MNELAVMPSGKSRVADQHDPFFYSFSFNYANGQWIV